LRIQEGTVCIATEWASLKEEKEPLVETSTIVLASDFGVELVEMLYPETIRFIINVPGEFVVDIDVEASDIIHPNFWSQVTDAVVTDLGDNRFEVIAPYSEDLKEFFRFIVTD
jgi:hypothetical protein